MNNNFLTKIVLIVAALAAGMLPARAAMTAEQVVQKASAAITGAKGIKCAFTLTVNNRAYKGTVKSQGNRFSVVLPQVSTWYDGKDLYTYNPRTQETTVTEPTAQELLESNPLLYVRGGAAAYACSFSPVKRTGKYIVDLVPRNKRSGLTKLTFTLNAKTFAVERIAVQSQGTQSVIDITSLDTNAVVPAADFNYPAAKYPKAEVIDLR